MIEPSAVDPVLEEPSSLLVHCDKDLLGLCQLRTQGFFFFFTRFRPRPSFHTLQSDYRSSQSSDEEKQTYEIPQIQCMFFDETFEYKSSSFIVWVVRDLDKVCPLTRFRKTHDELIYVGDSNACEKIEDANEDCRGTSGAIYR